MKFWLLLGLFLVVVWLVQGGRRSRKSKPSPPVPESSATPPAASPGSGEPAHEDMVACVHCGIHLPQSEAIDAPAGWFCGPAHRIAHDKAAPR